MTVEEEILYCSACKGELLPHGRLCPSLDETPIQEVMRFSFTLPKETTDDS